MSGKVSGWSCRRVGVVVSGVSWGAAREVCHGVGGEVCPGYEGRYTSTTVARQEQRGTTASHQSAYLRQLRPGVLGEVHQQQQYKQHQKQQSGLTLSAPQPLPSPHQHHLHHTTPQSPHPLSLLTWPEHLGPPRQDSEARETRRRRRAERDSLH
ncbi:hypothetical protein E2C01_095787 [Portunus trituberculatus]|uniref:Uncharacterized protein n=1 Tax=Portunus trituberculatus TaxID=210409 RepID=A0A5B7JW65_PORTR|nr:hypothetical protein [Portunus trituberculatus]